MATLQTVSSDSVPILQTTGLTRSYGAAVALRDVDLVIHPGERIALLGPNGAGKTTLLRVLAGVLRPTRGAVYLGGTDLNRSAPLRRTIGVVGHDPCLYDELSPRENLRFYGRLYGVRDIEQRITAVLDLTDAGHVADRPVRTLSRGTQQRVSLARALLHEPTLLLLDEPETGLDQAAQERFAALLRDWSVTGRAVLFASHRLDWADAVANRAVVLRGGRVAGDVTGTPPLGLEEQYRVLLAAGAAPARGDAQAETPLSRLTAPVPAPIAANSSPLAGASPSPPALGRQLATVIAKDVLLEWRTKDALAAMLVFALLTLVTFNFALDLRPEVMAAVGPGVLWVAVVFGSMLGPGRSFIREQEGGTLEGLLMAPLDRSTLFLGKLAVNLLVMAAVQMVSVPAFIVLFSVQGAIVPLAAVLIAGTVGLGAVETLLAAVAAHTRAREVMLPVLLLPIIVPIVIGVVQATGLALGNATAQDLPWMGLILAFDAIYLAAGVAVFDYVLEE